MKQVFLFLSVFLLLPLISADDKVPRKLSKEELKRYGDISQSSIYLEGIRHYQEGLIKYSIGDFEGAKLEFQQAIHVDPLYRECMEFIKRSEIHINSQSFNENLEALLAYEKGINYYLDDQYSKALGQWEAVSQMVPKNKGIKVLIIALQETIKKNQRSRSVRTRADQIFQSALKDYLGGNNQEVHGKLDSILNIFPSFRKAVILKQKLKEQQDADVLKYLNLGRDELSRGNTKAARNYAVAGLKLFPQNVNLRKLKSKSQSLIDTLAFSLLNEYKYLVQKKEYLLAHRKISRQYNHHPEHPALRDAFNDHQRLLQDMRNLEMGKAKNAERFITRGLVFLPDQIFITLLNAKAR